MFITLLAVLTAATSLAVPARQPDVGWTGPLSTQGRYIVDADGDRFTLKSGNWHGASGTWTGSGDRADPANHHAGEMSNGIPLGLDRAPMREIMDSFHELGINSVRLPFSNEMIRDGSLVPDAAVAANPQLRGRTRLQVYDAVVEALTAEGFAVILNNHTNTSRWCCGVDGNERWNSSQTTERWVNDWLRMARRYVDNPRVVGADLYNEVRRDVLDDPNWGGGDEHDWHAAAQLAADRILTEANPNLLIIIEGINWFGLPVDGFPHGRPTLEPARTLSHTLVRSDKLVYSAHFYGYTGPRHSGATGIGETSDPRYQDLSRAELFEVLQRQAFFVTEQGRHFTAPLWISEFGVGGREETDPKARAWFANMVDFLIARDTSFAYWPLVGWHEDRRGNGWALVHWDAEGNRMSIDDGDDWRAAAWRRLVTAPRGPARPADRWRQLAPDHADAVRSARMRAEPDWDRGARKAACPDGLRLVGLGHTGGRGLCSDAGGGAPWRGGYQVVADERHVDTDWAPGYTKFQCPEGHFATGYAFRGADLSSLLCVRSGGVLGQRSEVVWFDRGDSRPPAAAGGDFAHGHYKGQCARDAYVAGVAWTRRLGSPAGNPDALLCRSTS
ncbi:glycoside hydrolase family 5 protein [Amycolatopsis aidingensis]|uniref:glycoside hydrolase family 5 protein n=1 Tax=Amycolatopsis aidingensis TaxID=2842453 RepID=UPI001C0E5C01|nr:cellulase family glycosylhydrolase [Amycolatopsis aidingensis]